MTTTSREEAAIDLPRIEDFPSAGCGFAGPILDRNACARLRSWIDRVRPLRRSNFYESYEEFQEQGRWHHYAPGRTEHNLLVTEKPDLGFVEENEQFVRVGEKLVGKNYGIMKKAVIRTVPDRVVPAWVRDYVRDIGRPNLNPFIHDAFQDIQHFLRTDFHQDKTRPDSNFVTVYVYLDDVEENYSPLRLLKGSHRLGLTQYPHLLRKSYSNENSWFYSDTRGNHEKCAELLATGASGAVTCFHALTLHGTGPNDSEDPRISLRYLLTKNSECTEDTLLDQANLQVYGPHRATNVRLDVGPDGTLLPTGSSLIVQS